MTKASDGGMELPRAHHSGLDAFDDSRYSSTATLTPTRRLQVARLVVGLDPGPGRGTVLGQCYDREEGAERYREQGAAGMGIGRVDRVTRRTGCSGGSRGCG